MGFKDKIAKTVGTIRESATESASRALLSADRALKKSKLTDSIRRTQGDLSELYLSFAAKVHQNQGVSEEEVQVFLTDASSYTETIANLQKEIELLDSEVATPPANPADKGSDYVLCSKPECGKPIPPGQKFCGECGTPVEQ